MDADLQHPTVPEAISWRRVILHLDLDCFYGELERGQLQAARSSQRQLTGPLNHGNPNPLRPL